MENFKNEREVAQAVLERAKKLLDEHLSKKEEVKKMEGASEEDNKKFDSCVDKVQEQGKDEKSAHAICYASLKKTEKLKSFLAKRLAKASKSKV